MKTLVTILGLSLGSMLFAQKTSMTNAVNHKQINQEVTMEVTVDSAEDLEQTFKVQDIIDLMEMAEGSSARFKLTCRGERMSNGEFATMSYAIEKGDISDKEFVKMVKQLRKAAIAYYKQ
jgi:hypothetical protein